MWVHNFLFLFSLYSFYHFYCSRLPTNVIIPQWLCVCLHFMVPFLHLCCLWNCFTQCLANILVVFIWLEIAKLSISLPRFFCQSEGHRQILTKELEAVGLRLNQRPPQVSLCPKGYFGVHDTKHIFYISIYVGCLYFSPHFLMNSELCISWQIYFKKKKTGGISFNSTMPLTHVDEKLCYQILHEYKIHNAEV